jgi:hypothetical protein
VRRRGGRSWRSRCGRRLRESGLGERDAQRRDNETGFHESLLKVFKVCTLKCATKRRGLGMSILLEGASADAEND